MSDSKIIFAPASAIGKAGVTVFRISGIDAAQVILQLAEPNDLPAPRQAILRNIKNPKTGDKIDKAVIIYFQAPHSFTGEDVVELHTHGGHAVANAIIEALQNLPDFRLAEAGEFTRRAFENGKLDLTEAEAIADLVHADTEAQRKQALRQLEGALGKLYENWRHNLSQSLAYMEAAIDFSDEELPHDMIEKQSVALRLLRDEIASHLNDNHRGEKLRNGFSIAIIGPPNAGKSSLLNALARRDAAIVSPIAGTTRDVVEVHLDIAGYPVSLADTAGLRDAADSIENEGIRRAYARAAKADLKLLVLDANATPDAAMIKMIDADTIVIMNKADLTKDKTLPQILGVALTLSALTGSGIDGLLQKLGDEISRRFTDNGTPPLTRARHRAALSECTENLDRALAAQQVDLRAEDVRMAMRALGRITGRVDVEDLLEIIFRDFCIGK